MPGDLRGTDPTNAAARMAALALAAWDLQYAPVARPAQPLRIAKSRRKAGPRGSEDRTAPVSGGICG